MMLYQFKVYNILIQQFCTLLNDYHDRYNHHMSPHIIITIVLTVFLILYFFSLTYIFSNWKHVHFNPLYVFHSFSYMCPLATTTFFFMFKLLGFFVCFIWILESIYKWNYMIFVILSLAYST